MKPEILENWAVLEGDYALKKSVEKQIKWTGNTNSTVLDYQKDQLLKALQYVKKFDVAIDAGANYGLMSYHLSQRFKNVYAFEIATNVSACLAENVKRFQLNNVLTFSYGLGDANKNVDLEYKKQSSFATHVHPNVATGQFEIRTLDSMNLHECDFIKIDCEGYEPHIIRGAENTIKKFKPAIIMEDKNLCEIYGEDGQSAAILLSQWGYKKVVQFKKDCIMAYGG